jgi:hypothetical protein
VAAIFVNGSGQNVPSLERTAHRCFLPSFGSFGQMVSEEKNFKNQPIRNKSRLWRSCLLTDREEMSNLHRGPSIDASYPVCLVRLYLQLFVGALMSYLRYLCLFVYSGFQHILCCVFALFFFVLCTLSCQFLCMVHF